MTDANTSNFKNTVNFVDTTDDDDDVPDFSNWSIPSATTIPKLTKQTSETIEIDEEDDLPDFSTWRPSNSTAFTNPITQKSPILPQPKQQDDEVDFIANKISQMQKKKLTFDVANLLYDEEDDEEDEEIKKMSYEEWKKKQDKANQPSIQEQEKTFKSPLQMFDTLKQMSKDNDLRRPMHPQMSKEEHERFVSDFYIHNNLVGVDVPTV
jgi:hypothetical protein